MKYCVFSAMALAAVANSSSAKPLTTPFASPLAAERAVLLGEGTISTFGFETSGTLAPDGKTFYFTRGAPDFGQFFFTIMVTRFDKGRWTAPKIAPFSGEYADTSPFLSPDGQRLIFSSNRPVDGAAKSRSDFDLWTMERIENGWTSPKPLKSVNAPGWDMHSSMTRDGTLYFGSIRDNDYGIWRARLLAGEFQAPEPLDAPVNTKSVEYDPFIDPDGRYLIFGSDRAGGSGGADLYVSFFRAGRWSEPRNLGPKVNTAGREAGGFVVRDNGQAFLVFNSESGRALGMAMRPKHRMADKELAQILASTDNQLRNFYYIKLSALGIEGLE